MKEVVAYTDGACSGNPGPGGWGVLLEALADKTVVKTRELNGGDGYTTNNRMELMAAIRALESLKFRSKVTIVTDSQYLKNGITQWIERWKANGWLTRERNPVKNSDLWQRLDKIRGDHHVEWRWVRGHADDSGNEKADRLARDGMQPYKSGKSRARSGKSGLPSSRK